MKTVLFFLPAASVMLLGGGFSNEKRIIAEEEMTLQEAEKRTLVKSKSVSNGDYSGDCIDLSLTNTKWSPVKIKIPAGTVFIADDEGDQNILVTKDIFCKLKPGESRSFDISGYCCEKSDSSPDDGSGFKTSLHNDEKVQKLVKFLNTKNYSDNVNQDIVWCVANGSSISTISLDDDEQHKELRKFISDLTGQEDTWYATPQKHYLDENRNISSEATEVKGILSCTIDRPMNVTNEVYSIDNKLQYALKEPMKFEEKGTYFYEFRVRISGWEKGKYYVLIKGNGKELLKQEFEI